VGERLHPAAAVAGAGESLRGLLLPILVAALLGGGVSSETPRNVLVYGLIGVVVSLVVGVAQWRNETWSVDERGVHHRRGVFSRKETTIPRERVHAVDTVRGPVQRLFGVVALNVQAAGGGKRPEIVLRAVTPADAAALRATLGLALEERAAGPARRLGMGALLVTAATAGQIGVLLPLVAGLSSFADEILGSEEAQTLVPDTAGEALVFAGVVVGVAWLLSFFGAVVAFAGFEIVRDGDRLRVRRGLLQRREASIPVDRVVGVRIVESALRQPFGLAEVRLEAAGVADEARPARTLFPLLPARAVPQLLEEMLPEHRAVDAALVRSPPRALRRFLLGPLLVTAPVAALAWALLGPPGAAGLALVAGALALGVARHRAAAGALHEERLVLRGRAVSRVTLVADARRLHQLGVRDTLLTRRAQLTSLGVGLASGATFSVRHLDRAFADQLLDRATALSR
jgi:putative membrane protein